MKTISFFINVICLIGLVSGGSPFSDVLSAQMSTPLSLMLYHSNSTTFDTTSPCPSHISLVTGTSISIKAKIIDRLGVWLPQYQDTSYNRSFSWKLVQDSVGLVNLTDSLGSTTNVTINTRHATTAYVISRFQDANTILADTLTVTIVPLLPLPQLVIEPLSRPTQDPYTADPIDTILFSSPDTSITLISVLRDLYGNLITECSSTVWISLDTSVAKISPLTPMNGQVVIVSSSLVGEATIIAQYISHDTTFSDTAVLLSSQTSTLQNNNHAFSSPKYSIIPIQGRGLRVITGTTPRIQGLMLYDLFGRLVSSNSSNLNDASFMVRTPNTNGLYVASIRTDRNFIGHHTPIASRFLFPVIKR